MQKLIKWIIKVWIYLHTFIAGGVLSYLILNHNLSITQTLTGTFIIILVLHIFEEWIWPAGLHYIHNLWLKSPDPNTYPMNQWADVITNSLAVFIGIAALIFWGNNSIANLTIAGFGILEFAAHTQLSFVSLKHFRDHEMRIFYSPGLATACGFLINSVCIIYDLAIRNQFSVAMIIGTIITLVILAVILVLLPENGLKSRQTPYRFPSAGIYEHYLDPKRRR